MILGNGTANPRLSEKPHDIWWQSAIYKLRIYALQVRGALVN
jgi:hypothetical protein